MHLAKHNVLSNLCIGLIDKRALLPGSNGTFPRILHLSFWLQGKGRPYYRASFWIWSLTLTRNTFYFTCLHRHCSTILLLGFPEIDVHLFEEANFDTSEGGREVKLNVVHLKIARPVSKQFPGSLQCPGIHCRRSATFCAWISEATWRITWRRVHIFVLLVDFWDVAG